MECIEAVFVLMACKEAIFALMTCIEEVFVLMVCKEPVFVIIACVEAVFVIMACVESVFVLMACVESVFVLMARRQLSVVQWARRSLWQLLAYREKPRPGQILTVFLSSRPPGYYQSVGRGHYYTLNIRCLLVLQCSFQLCFCYNFAIIPQKTN